MNWLIRFGQWCENRRVVRKPELRTLEIANQGIRERMATQAKRIQEIYDLLDPLTKSLAISPTTLKELALINARLNQLELYVGLKREPKPEHVPGAAKIS